MSNIHSLVALGSDPLNHALLITHRVDAAAHLKCSLETLGYVVTVAISEASAIEAAERLKPAILVVDVHLDGSFDEINVVEEIRKNFTGALVFVSEHTNRQVLERVARYDPSAYLLRPIDATVFETTIYLAARKSEYIRRMSDSGIGPGAAVPTASMIQLADLKIDPAGRTVFRRGVEIHLTQKEMDILICLAEHPGATVSPEVILTRAWGSQFTHYVQALRVHVGNLRKKIETGDDPFEVRILGVRGRGYRVVFKDSTRDADSPAAA